jgi:integrase
MFRTILVTGFKAGIPIKVVSERLGHATPGFTMATYQHVLPGMQAEAARTFASLIASTDFNPVEEPVEVPERDEALARSAS